MAARSQSPFPAQKGEVKTFAFWESLQACAHTTKEVYEELRKEQYTEASGRLLMAFDDAKLAALHLVRGFGLQVGPMPPNTLDIQIHQWGHHVPCQHLLLIKNAEFDTPQAIKIKTPPGTFVIADQASAILEKSASMPEMLFIGLKPITQADMEEKGFKSKLRITIYRRDMDDNKTLRRYHAAKTRSSKAAVAGQFWAAKDTKDDGVAYCYINVKALPPTTGEQPSQHKK